MSTLDRFFLALTFGALGVHLASGSPIMAGLQCLAAAVFFGGDLVHKAIVAAWKRLRCTHGR